jgi:V8-like Glu-specific endopeptidase
MNGDGSQWIGLEVRQAQAELARLRGCRGSFGSPTEPGPTLADRGPDGWVVVSEGGVHEVAVGAAAGGHATLIAVVEPDVERSRTRLSARSAPTAAYSLVKQPRYRVLEFPWTAVGPIETLKLPHHSYGSGVLVGPRHVLTAAHVLADGVPGYQPILHLPPIWKSTFTPGQVSTTDRPLPSRLGQKVYFAYRNVTVDGHVYKFWLDLAVLVLEDSPQPVHWWGMCNAAQGLEESFLQLWGYGNYKEPTGKYLGGHAWRSACYVTRIDYASERIEYGCQAIPTMSGGPVTIHGLPEACVAGVHLGTTHNGREAFRLSKAWIGQIREIICSVAPSAYHGYAGC